MAWNSQLSEVCEAGFADAIDDRSQENVAKSASTCDCGQAQIADGLIRRFHQNDQGPLFLPCFPFCGTVSGAVRLCERNDRYQSDGDAKPQHD